MTFALADTMPVGGARLAAKRRIAACYAIVLAVATLALCAVPSAAWARDLVDTDATCSLSLAGIPDDAADAEFRLYKVADVSTVGDEYAWTDDCAAYAAFVSLEADDQARWCSLAQTLSTYAARDDVPAVATARADAGGSLSFSGLSTGLYLVTGPAHTGDRAVYEFEPVLLQLPGLVEAADSASGSDEWVYDVSAEVKWGSDVVSSISAVKVWKGDDAASRPESIDVQLLRDGAVHDAATLSERNNWRVTWDDLDPSHEWQVAEAAVPEGYEVLIDCERGVFTVTNTFTTPEGGEPGGPGNPGGPDGSDGDGGAAERLPQTGQLWWPVPVLLLAGSALVLAGRARRLRSEKRADADAR